MAEEFARLELELMTRIVFYRAPSALRKDDPLEIYSVRVFADGAAHFGSGPGPDHFEVDDWQDGWLSRNMIRLASSSPPLPCRRRHDRQNG